MSVQWPPSRWNRTTPTLIGYRFEACTPDHREFNWANNILNLALYSPQSGLLFSITVFSTVFLDLIQLKTFDSIIFIDFMVYLIII